MPTLKSFFSFVPQEAKENTAAIRVRTARTDETTFLSVESFFIFLSFLCPAGGGTVKNISGKNKPVPAKICRDRKNSYPAVPPCLTPNKRPLIAY